MGRSHHDSPYSGRPGRSHKDRGDKRFIHRLERRMGRKDLEDLELDTEAPREPEASFLSDLGRRPLRNASKRS